MKLSLALCVLAAAGVLAASAGMDDPSSVYVFLAGIGALVLLRGPRAGGRVAPRGPSRPPHGRAAHWHWPQWHWPQWHWPHWHRAGR